MRRAPTLCLLAALALLPALVAADMIVSPHELEDLPGFGSDEEAAGGAYGAGAGAGAAWAAAVALLMRLVAQLQQGAGPAPTAQELAEIEGALSQVKATTEQRAGGGARFGATPAPSRRRRASERLSLQFTDDDGDTIELRTDGGPVELCDMRTADARRWTAQHQLRWDPTASVLHDDGGRMPLRGAQHEGLLDRIRALVAGSTTQWLEPAQLPDGWEAHVDAATLQPYFVDERGKVHARPPPAPAPAPVAEVLFRGQTLTRTNVAEVAQSEPLAGYEGGWACDGCSATGSEQDAIIYHGAVEPDNPLEINAFDLCERCAANVPATERRYQEKADRAAERERRQFRDEWQQGRPGRGGRPGGGGGGGQFDDGAMMAVAMVSRPAAAVSPETRPASSAKQPRLTGAWQRPPGRQPGAKILSQRCIATIALTISLMFCLYVPADAVPAQWPPWLRQHHSGQNCSHARQRRAFRNGLRLSFLWLEEAL